jgi:hypothetical protein
MTLPSRSRRFITPISGLRRRSAQTAFWLFASVALVLGCEAGRMDGIGVDNRLGQELRFEIEIDGRLIRLATHALPRSTARVLAAGDLRSGDCTTAPLVAYDPDGREVARHDPPLCVGDTWTIE